MKVSLDLKAYDVPGYGSCFYEAVSALLNQGLMDVNTRFNPSFLRKLIVGSIATNLNNVQTRIIDFARIYQMNANSAVNASTAFGFVNQELTKNPQMTDQEIVQNYIRSILRDSCYVSELDVNILNEFLMKNYNIYIFAFTVKPLGSPKSFDNNHPIVKRMKHILNSHDYEHVEKFAAVVTDEVHYNYLMFVTHHEVLNATSSLHVPIIAKRVLKHALSNFTRPIKLTFERGQPEPFILKRTPHNSKNRPKKTRNVVAHPITITKENAQNSPMSPKKIKNSNNNNNAKLAQQLRNDESKTERLLANAKKQSEEMALEIRRKQNNTQRMQNAMIAKKQQEENNAAYARQLQQIEQNAQMAETLSREGSPQFFPNNSRFTTTEQRNNTRNNAALARRLSNLYARGQNSPAVFPR